MRIVYLSASEIPSRTANSVHVMKMCAAFAREGHTTCLLGRAGHERAVDPFAFYGVAPTFELVTLPQPPVGALRSFSYARSAVKAIRQRVCDLIYARHSYSCAAASRLGIPFIYEVHNIPGTWLERLTVARMIRLPHFIRLVAISQALATEYQRLYPTLPPTRVRVAHDGADVLSEPRSAASDRTAGPSSERHFRVGYVGGLYDGKGMELILTISQALPRFEFHVVGGTPEDLARWRALGNGGRRIVFHGFVPHGSLDDIVSSFDVVLAPYQRRVTVRGNRGDIARWMSPLKLFEYMAHQKPIIASDLPVLREVLTHRVNAVLCDPDDPAAWVTAIESLAADAGLRERLAAHAYRDLCCRYLWTQRAARVLES